MSDNIGNFFRNYIDSKTRAVAYRFAEELRKTLSTPWTTAKAVRGAPPRKKSGRMVRSIYVQSVPHKGYIIYQVVISVPYARKHEYGAHPYMLQTLRRLKLTKGARAFASPWGTSATSPIITRFTGNN